jgi:hypothetical protein
MIWRATYRGLCPLTPTMNLALQAVPQKRFWTPKNFKIIDKSCFLEVLRILKGLATFANGKFAPSLRGYFQKSLKRGAGVEPLHFTID